MGKHAHEERLEKAVNKERVRRLQKRNGLPVISGKWRKDHYHFHPIFYNSGKWRKEPYAARAYEYLTDYAVTANLGVDIKEVPVWGIDCYTRRMVEMAIEDRVDSEQRDAKSIKKFIERALLPTINDQPSDKAYDMTNTNPKSSALDRLYAEAVLASIQEYTIDVFRIHPKGTGVICINPADIQPHVLGILQLQ
eukprot:gene11036-12868_t